MSIIVSKLFIYPIKSAAGISVKTLQLSGMGPSFDRRFMIVDETGRFYTQREDSRLCFIKPSYVENGLRIVIDQYGELTLPLPVADSPIDVSIWNDDCEVTDCGDSSAFFLSRYLGKSVRLVYMGDDVTRLVDKKFANNHQTVSFADGFPLLLCSDNSLENFNRYLNHPITVERFRPNLVVSGAPAYAEDLWRQLRIGNIILDVVKPCSRCVIPSIDPHTGEKHVEVSQALAKHRRMGNDVFFGQNVLFKHSGVINLGDPVEIMA